MVGTLSKRDESYLSVATYLAGTSSSRMKHGAIITKNGRVLATGINKDRNNPNIVSSEHIEGHCSVHAEVDALKKVKDVKGATIYIARVNRRGQERMSKPCDRCYETIIKSGIKKIVYTR
jgi:deoxycytidylate deaminase